jgi:hypothetical protein
VTNVPSQALYLMNNTFVREQARAMAKRLLESDRADDARIAIAYRRALGRAPTNAEQQRAAQYLRDTKSVLAGKSAEPAWASFCQALFASAEFRYVR